MSAVENLVTVIITTSITPSAPATELVSSVLQSFREHCPALGRCRVIVVIDAYDRITPSARLKKGCVTPEQAEAFKWYKKNVKQLILGHYGQDNTGAALTKGIGEAEFGSPNTPQNSVPIDISHTRDKWVTFIEPRRRIGFGLAVRSALRMTETPYVWVQQHDWILSAKCPLDHLLPIMQASSGQPAPIEYVCFLAIRMLSYAITADVTEFPELKALTQSLSGDFSPPDRPDVKIPLTPLYFWHDKPHIASTAHYLARVFPSRLAVLRGDFIEDKIGQRARAQMKEGQWAKWATWLYYPDQGNTLCLRHLQGRTRRAAEQEAWSASRKDEQQRKNRSQRSDIGGKKDDVD